MSMQKRFSYKAVAIYEFLKLPLAIFIPLSLAFLLVSKSSLPLGQIEFIQNLFFLGVIFAIISLITLYIDQTTFGLNSDGRFSEYTYLYDTDYKSLYPTNWIFKMAIITPILRSAVLMPLTVLGVLCLLFLIQSIYGVFGFEQFYSSNQDNDRLMITTICSCLYLYNLFRTVLFMKIAIY